LGGTRITQAGIIIRWYDIGHDLFSQKVK
jgi:hypothetical protein